MENKGIEQLEKHLVPMFADAIEKKIFSAAAAAVFFHQKNSIKKRIFAFGRTRNDEKGEQVKDDTLFDLASLTKPLCTVPCILSLLENKELEWNTDLNILKNDKNPFFFKKITIEQLLSHSAGLIDYKPFYKDFEAVYVNEAKKLLLNKIKNEPLVYHPGEKCVYSDIGYMLLGEVVEKITGMGIDKYFTEFIAKPLKVDRDILFRPLSLKNEKKVSIAATEMCPWRKRLLQGEVHDEHSWLMGGAAGHAGLFGTAAGVLAMAENILYQWQGKVNHPAYRYELIQKALAWKKENQTWSMGFDRPSAKGSSAGNYFSKNSAGHLGFTGTSFWIDPEREIIAVLLTNRVHPTRRNEEIKKFRPLFHDTVIRSLKIQ